MTASSQTVIFMAVFFFVFFCFISLLHAGYIERLEAHCAVRHATRWDKEQTNIRAALSNPDQSVCQGPDKLTGRRGQREVEEVVCVGCSLLTLEGAFPLWALMSMNITTDREKHFFLNWEVLKISEESAFLNWINEQIILLPHFIHTKLTLGCFFLQSQGHYISWYWL